MKITKSHADEAAPKIYYGTALKISGISVTILKIICWYGLIFDGLKDNLLISGYILKTEPERIMTTIDTLLPENFTIPPLVAIISINVFLIFCIKMRTFSYEYCTWIEGKAGNFLKFVDNCGLSVCYYNCIQCTLLYSGYPPQNLALHFLIFGPKIWPIFAVNRLNWHCCLTGSSKTAPIICCA